VDGRAAPKSVGSVLHVGSVQFDDHRVPTTDAFRRGGSLPEVWRERGGESEILRVTRVASLRAHVIGAQVALKCARIHAPWPCAWRVPARTSCRSVYAGPRRVGRGVPGPEANPEAVWSTVWKRPPRTEGVKVTWGPRLSLVH